MTLAPGIHHGVPARIYHADPAPEPSLSSSLARRLLEVTPRKARLEHPRFAAQEQSSPTRQAEIGTAAHCCLASTKLDLRVIDAEDYKTKAAQEARRAAYADHASPILIADMATAEIMAGIANRALEDEGLPPLSAVGEAVAIARDPQGCFTRAMIDLLFDFGDSLVVVDYKTTAQEIGPNEAGRFLVNQGYDVQEAFYRRILTLAHPKCEGRIRFLFLIQDQAAPHDCLLVEPTAEMRHIADQKVSVAIGIWSRCMATGEWPGHPPGIIAASPPGYIESQWSERALFDPAFRNLPHDPFIRPLPSAHKLMTLTP